MYNNILTIQSQLKVEKCELVEDGSIIAFSDNHSRLLISLNDIINITFTSYYDFNVITLCLNTNEKIKLIEII